MLSGLATLNMFFLLLLSAFLVTQGIAGSISPATCIEPRLSAHLEETKKKFGHSAVLRSIGKTDSGTNIWTLIISDSISNPRPLLRPQIKFVGNINGFSGPSCFILLKLIEYLLEGELEGGAEVRRILSTAQLHILPNLNPDGYVKSIPGSCDGAEGRLNGVGVDLNRNFPRPFEPIDEEVGHYAAETQAIMSWVANNDFLLSISLFSGAIVVTYPFDAPPPRKKAKEHFTPDDDVFLHLASTYVESSGFHDLDDSVCPRLERSFQNGMINGAEWSPVLGTMQDFNYISGTMELMIGISCCRNENRTRVLDDMWERNKHSLLAMMGEVNYGVRGQVIHGETKEPIHGASLYKIPQHEIETQRPSMEFTTNRRGEFWRLAIPGNYFLSVNFEGFESQLIFFNVNMRNHTILLVELQPFQVQEKEGESSQKPFYELLDSSTILQESNVDSHGHETRREQALFYGGNEENHDDFLNALIIENKGCLKNCYLTMELLFIILSILIK